MPYLSTDDNMDGQNNKGFEYNDEADNSDVRIDKICDKTTKSPGLIDLANDSSKHGDHKIHRFLASFTKLKINTPWNSSHTPKKETRGTNTCSYLDSLDFPAIDDDEEGVINSQGNLERNNINSKMTDAFQSKVSQIDELPTKSHINEGFVITSKDELNSDQLDKPDQENNIKNHQEESKIYDENPVIWTQVLGAISSAAVHLAVGCVVGFTGVTLPSLMDPESNDLTLDKFQASLFSSIVNIGAIGGSILSSLMMTWLGQRSTLLVYLPIGIIFWIIMAFSRTFWLLILCRIMQGTVIGVCAGCANNYVVETAHKSVRGRLFATIDLALQAGFFFVYVVGSSQLSWRNISLVCGILSMALPFVGMIFLPHSPRWLNTQGRKLEARKSLTFFRGKNFDVDAELRDIERQFEKSENSTKVLDQIKMLGTPSIITRFLVIGILLFASHFTGNFALIAYSVSIFKSANISMNPYICTVLTAAVRILGVLIYATVADKFGRRLLFMIPLGLSGVAMFALGFFFFVQSLTDNVESISWLPLTSIIFYVIFTMMSHPVLMLLRSELLPTAVRSVGVGLLYLFFFAGSFAVSISYPYMVDFIGSHWTFWLYGATSFAMILITAISIPETQGKSLEDIGEMFENKGSKKNKV